MIIMYVCTFLSPHYICSALGYGLTHSQFMTVRHLYAIVLSPIVLHWAMGETPLDCSALGFGLTRSQFKTVGHLNVIVLFLIVLHVAMSVTLSDCSHWAMG